MFPLRDSVPSRHFPFVTYALIAVNIAVFIKEINLPSAAELEAFINAYGLIPVAFLSEPVGNILKLFTSMFVHGGWMHLIGNMWFLYVFGDNVEDNLGAFRYLIYYLLVGICAGVSQAFAAPNSTLPMVGASGAIAGVLGGYIILHPRARVHTFFIFVIFVRFIEVPAFIFLGYWFLIQALNGYGALQMAAANEQVGGVAWWAHASGFVAGFIFILFFKKRGDAYF